MGRYCGYLALMGAMSTGANGSTSTRRDQPRRLSADFECLRQSFASGRKLFLAIRNENANPLYTTDFLARLLEQESHGTYDVRQNILGHMQQGGAPSPFDRLLAVRLVSRALDLIGTEFDAGTSDSYYLDSYSPRSRLSDEQMMAEMDLRLHRPKNQWWLALRRSSERSPTSRADGAKGCTRGFTASPAGRRYLK